jgi:formylmethanofuran dehydrogenase subunit E
MKITIKAKKDKIIIDNVVYKKLSPKKKVIEFIPDSAWSDVFKDKKDKKQKKKEKKEEKISCIRCGEYFTNVEKSINCDTVCDYCDNAFGYED